MFTITHKPYLAHPKPYPALEVDQYLAYLRDNAKDLSTGNIGIYLSRQVSVNDQTLYFLFIDIDGQPNLTGDDKIQNAIFNATMTARALEQMQVLEKFTLIATGGKGFRMVSSVLVDNRSHSAFCEMLRREMPFIVDLRPSQDTEMPHQIFTYKGHPNQNKKDLPDRHSTIVPFEELFQETMTPDRYKKITAGYLDEVDTLHFMEKFLQFEQIVDITALGPFGRKLIEYKQVNEQIIKNRFDIAAYRRNSPASISLPLMKQMLNDKGIHCRIEKRPRDSISFKNLPCPACKKSSTNAWASPPSYRLHCFNESCSAAHSKGGMPLSKWAGISNGDSDKSLEKTENPFSLKHPEHSTTSEDARRIIAENITSTEDVLIKTTPGVGKTYGALEALSRIASQKVIICSSYNKALKEEAYETIRRISPDSEHFYLLKARDELCHKRRDLKTYTDNGLSPADLLCRTCLFTSSCAYRTQKDFSRKGIYFVTHHMLPYLPNHIPCPDLILLDEDIAKGFLMKEHCTDSQIRSLASGMTENQFTIVNRFISLAERQARLSRQNGSLDLLINASKLTSESLGEDTLLSMISTQMLIPESELIAEIAVIVANLESKTQHQLYESRISRKAIFWLKGFVSPEIKSFISISRNGDRISYDYKSITPLPFPNTTVKLLDATGNKIVAEALTQRKDNMVDISVDWKCNGTHVKFSTNRYTVEHARDKTFTKPLQAALEQISKQKILLITYQDHMQKILDICQNLAPSKQFKTYHFHAPRGINSYSDCDAVLVFGLPYPNINSAYQDSLILFPEDKSIDTVDSWINYCMNSEIYQNIHRTRPVNKPGIELVIVSNLWPNSLPKPDRIIDMSRNNSWKEALIERLEPFVREFGFLNTDIGFLAGVCIKDKVKNAEKFMNPIEQVIRTTTTALSVPEVNSMVGQHIPLQESFYSPDVSLFNSVDPADTNSLHIKSILYIYILYIQNLLRRGIRLPFQLIKLSNYRVQGINNHQIIFCNQNQWTDVGIYFKQKYPHFESFSIKLPHSRNNAVKGVGSRQAVEEFYSQLPQITGLKEIDLKTYKTLETATRTFDPLPKGTIIVLIPEHEVGPTFVAVEDRILEFHDFPKDLENNELIEEFTRDSTTEIITNNGHYLAKMLVQAGYNQILIHDITLSHKIISNGKILPKKLTLSSIFKAYGLTQNPDVYATVAQINQVWKWQQDIVQKQSLSRVLFECEEPLIWTIARLELTGIPVDTLQMLAYEEFLERAVQNASQDLSTLLPDNVDHQDEKQLKAYLNDTYGLHVDNLNKASLQRIKHPEAAAIAKRIIAFQASKMELSRVSSLTRLVENDERIRDEINQLGSKTGRINRRLQGTPRQGPIRSFFHAQPGYVFIKADYSQQEPRILAYASGDRNMMRIFNEGRDIYSEVSSMIFPTSNRSLSQNRKIAKQILLGLINGRGVQSIHDEILAEIDPQIPHSEVDKFTDQILDELPTAFRWLQDGTREARQRGHTETPLGRRLHVEDATGSRSISNFKIQGTAADGFKLCLLDLERKLKSIDAQIAHVIHDEIIVECRVEIAEIVEDILQHCMESAYDSILPGSKFKAEPEVVDSWGKPVECDSSIEPKPEVVQRRTCCVNCTCFDPFDSEEITDSFYCYTARDFVAFPGHETTCGLFDCRCCSDCEFTCKGEEYCKFLESSTGGCMNSQCVPDHSN